MLPELPATYVAHLVDPPALGDIEDAHAAGESGSMVGGRGVRMTLAYRACPENGSVIREARTRVFGSPALRAPASWLAAAVRGASWDAACRHTPASVLDALSEGSRHTLPEAVERGAGSAVQALRRALGVAGDGPPADPTDAGILVCRCVGVGDRPIRAAIRAGAADPEQVGEATGACTGCRSCRPDILAMIDEETRPAIIPPAAARHPAARITWACAGPLVRGLGLPLAGVEVEGGRIGLRFEPPGPAACLSRLGALALVRQVLRDTVTDAIQVELLA